MSPQTGTFYELTAAYHSKFQTLLSRAFHAFYKSSELSKISLFHMDIISGNSPPFFFQNELNLFCQLSHNYFVDFMFKQPPPF